MKFEGENGDIIFCRICACEGTEKVRFTILESIDNRVQIVEIGVLCFFGGRGWWFEFFLVPL